MADANTGHIGDPEEIELRELEAAEAEDREEDDEGDEETNLDEENENLEWDDSTLVPQGSQGFSPDPYWGREAPQGDIPNVLRCLKRTITQDRKIFLKNALDVSLNKGDGPNSATIFDNLQLTNDLRSGKNNGAKYKGVKIIVMNDGRYEYSSNSSGKTTRVIEEFKATLEKAEHEKTAIGDTEKQFRDFGVEDVSQEDAVLILSSIEERLSNRLAELEDDILEVRRGGLTKAEVDEIIGVLAFDRTGNMSPEDQIKTLTEVEIPFWKEKLNESEEGSVRSKQIAGIIEMLEIKSDVLRIRNNQKPETDLVKKLIKEEVQTGDISRFKKFSKWAKENTFGLSAVLISAAGILTTILIAGRGAIRSGARATKNFASVLAKIAKKSAPVFGALLNLIGSALSLGAKGLAWLANNLWALALLLAYLAYEELVKKRK